MLFPKQHVTGIATTRVDGAAADSWREPAILTNDLEAQ